MFIVRFPSGVSITYNSANHLDYDYDGRWRLYIAPENKGGRWVASIQPAAGVIVQSTRAREAENPGANPSGVEAVEMLMQNLKSVSHWQLKKLKLALANYNARTYSWKD